MLHADGLAELTYGSPISSSAPLTSGVLMASGRGGAVVQDITKGVDFRCLAAARDANDIDSRLLLLRHRQSSAP